VSQVSLFAWPQRVVRAVIALCALTLLATAVATGAAPATATNLSSQISSSRSGQAAAARAMRQHDQTLQANVRQRKAARKALRKARTSLKRNKQGLAFASALVGTRRARFAKAQTVYADALARASIPPDDTSGDPPTEPVAKRDGPTVAQARARLTEARKSMRVAERRLADKRKRVRIDKRSVGTKKARLRSLKRQQRATISRRESAEASLAARIIQMTQLAAERAENQASVSYVSSTAFSWPSLGRISQTYGCTGFRLSPRRGSCRHFHDGLDIVAGYGSPVRSVAVGVVAYSGWNPWDESGRAWIVVVVHPDGWVSRYGHLIATNTVRAGDVIHTGGTIGKMGNTGRSTGTHLHFELLRGGDDVNPLSYLPAGVVKIKIDKTSTKKGQQAANAKARKQAKAVRVKAVRVKERARASAAAEVAALESDTATSESCLSSADLQALGEAPYGLAFATDVAGTEPCHTEPEPVQSEPPPQPLKPTKPLNPPQPLEPAQLTTRLDPVSGKAPVTDAGELERGASPVPA
jgi:murein DD-endopeptidase MepM/ murein hydrolase activator NlpD